MILIPLSSIKADIQAQPRAAMDMKIVAEYAEAMVSGDQFPPLVVYQEGDRFWLADGFHRFYAAQGGERTEILCDVRQGTLRDAVLFSVGANAVHGQRRSDEDKRNAVQKLLDDPEWSHWADREIARQCSVSHEFVRKRRPAPVTVNIDSEPRTFTTKHGTVSQMNTASIGRRYPASQEQPKEPAPFNAFAQGDASIFNDLVDIDQYIKRMPDPEVAARNFPDRLRHSFTADRFAEIAEWFLQFSEEWKTMEAKNVAAE